MGSSCHTLGMGYTALTPTLGVAGRVIRSPRPTLAKLGEDPSSNRQSLPCPVAKMECSIRSLPDTSSNRGLLELGNGTAAYCICDTHWPGVAVVPEWCPHLKGIKQIKKKKTKQESQGDSLAERWLETRGRGPLVMCSLKQFYIQHSGG